MKLVTVAFLHHDGKIYRIENLQTSKLVKIKTCPHDARPDKKSQFVCLFTK